MGLLREAGDTLDLDGTKDVGGVGSPRRRRNLRAVGTGGDRRKLRPAPAAAGAKITRARGHLLRWRCDEAFRPAPSRC
jgi:hypothetical protein